MDVELSSDRIPCPACGGAGGGPIGRAGSAWDDEDYVCFKCEGVGTISLRPGLVKATPDAAPAVPAVPDVKKHRKASA